MPSVNRINTHFDSKYHDNIPRYPFRKCGGIGPCHHVWLHHSRYALTRTFRHRGMGIHRKNLSRLHRYSPATRRHPMLKKPTAKASNIYRRLMSAQIYMLPTHSGVVGVVGVVGVTRQATVVAICTLISSRRQLDAGETMASLTLCTHGTAFT